jgi:biopolymer transport protein ExbD
MKLKTRHTFNTQFSLASMTDIVFLLLIFFMLTVSFVPPIGLTVDLPTSHNSNTVTPQVKVTITKNLVYYIDNQIIESSHLQAALQEKLLGTSKLVLLQIDQSVPVQQMIQVVDIANGLQAQVSIATRPD